MNIFAWFRTLWHRDAVNKATAAAKALLDGITTDQFQVVVDEVEKVAKEPITGIEKAAKVKDIVTNPTFSAAYRFPSWVKEGIDLGSTIIQLAWVVAKLTKRI